MIVGDLGQTFRCKLFLQNCKMVQHRYHKQTQNQQNGEARAISQESDIRLDINLLSKDKWGIIVSSSTIDKIYEITLFTKIGTKSALFTKMGTKFS